MTPRFLTRLEATPLPDGVNWQLDCDLVFIDNQGDLHKVPAGFITDFASIPSLDRIGLGVALVGWYFIMFHGWSLTWKDAVGLPLLCAGFFLIFMSKPLNGDDQLDAPDALHDNGYARPRLGRRSWMMKFYWDRLLFQAMRANQEPLWKCWLVWANVTAFGWFAWYQDGKKSNPQ